LLIAEDVAPTAFPNAAKTMNPFAKLLTIDDFLVTAGDAP